MLINAQGCWSRGSEELYDNLHSGRNPGILYRESSDHRAAQRSYKAWQNSVSSKIQCLTNFYFFLPNPNHSCVNWPYIWPSKQWECHMLVTGTESCSREKPIGYTSSTLQFQREWMRRFHLLVSCDTNVCYVVSAIQLDVIRSWDLVLFV